MNNVKVSKQIIDDDLFIRSEKLKINNKIIRTPIKSITMNHLRRDIEVSPTISGVNEIFKTIKYQDIKKYFSGEKDEKNIYKDIKTHMNKTQKDNINLCFVQLTSEKLPEGKEIDFLTNISYINSDITPLPLVHGLFKEGKDANQLADKFFGFMDNSIESINRLNNKPILGIIPSSMPSIFIGDLIEFYHERNITSFAFDFQGKIYSNFEQHIREIMSKILNLDISNESFLYACNTSRGKVTKGTNITKANDVLVYNYGFDIMGDSHVRRALPPSVVKGLKKRSGSEQIIRLFNSEDYGHYKYNNKDLAKNMYPSSETKIPFDAFDINVNKKKAGDSEKLFNDERIGFELLKYNKLLNENDSALEYINTKKQIVDSLGEFKSYRSELNSEL